MKRWWNLSQLASYPVHVWLLVVCLAGWSLVLLVLLIGILLLEAKIISTLKDLNVQKPQDRWQCHTGFCSAKNGLLQRDSEKWSQQSFEKALWGCVPLAPTAAIKSPPLHCVATWLSTNWMNWDDHWDDPQWRVRRVPPKKMWFRIGETMWFLVSSLI